MLLAVEGLGFIIGFLIGFFRKKLNTETSILKKKVLILGTLCLMVVFIFLGFITFIRLLNPGNLLMFRDYVLGFLLFILLGWAIGMFADWLVGKVSN
ncbi:MAG: hypothetical protein U9R58_11280 [Chloroflexota bacterium]|nr:hypothetical protein [Chloroflexota bacterium]